jgi:hypothetical protein
MPDGADQKARGMMRDPVRWADDVEEVISGDITAAAAYITPAGSGRPLTWWAQRGSDQ